MSICARIDCCDLTRSCGGPPPEQLTRGPMAPLVDLIWPLRYHQFCRRVTHLQIAVFERHSPARDLSCLCVTSSVSTAGIRGSADAPLVLCAAAVSAGGPPSPEETPHPGAMCQSHLDKPRPARRHCRVESRLASADQCFASEPCGGGAWQGPCGVVAAAPVTSCRVGLALWHGQTSRSQSGGSRGMDAAGAPCQARQRVGRQTAYRGAAGDSRGCACVEASVFLGEAVTQTDLLTRIHPPSQPQTGSGTARAGGGPCLHC